MDSDAMKDDVMTRPAIETDLPTVHMLIMESFVALLHHISSAYRQAVIDAATSLCENELSVVEKFHEESFLLLPGGYNFWVAVESSSGFVVGCVGAKRRSPSEVELIHMAVSPALLSYF
jgi:hypothetical protein